MSNLQKDQNIEKYRELYDYARDLHFRQIERANRIDQKAAMFLSAITVLIGFAGFFLKATIDGVIPPQGKIESIFLVAVLLSGLTVVVSWFSFLLVLRARKLENLRLDEKSLEFFRNNRRVDVHYGISKRAVEAFGDNDIHIAAKLRRLTCGYLSALVGVVLLAISLSIFCYLKWKKPEPKPYERTYKVSIMSNNQKGDIQMPEETNNSGQEQQSDAGSQGDQSSDNEQLPDDQPNTDVQAPTNIIQTEGVEYSQIMTRDAGKSKDKSE